MSSLRAIPGQSVTERLFGRFERRAHGGPSTSFFERLGLADPFAYHDGLPPESGAAGGLGPDAFSWLSAAGWRAELALAGLRGRMLWRIATVRHDALAAGRLGLPALHGFPVRTRDPERLTRPMDLGDDAFRWLDALPVAVSAADGDPAGPRRGAGRWPVTAPRSETPRGGPFGRASTGGRTASAPRSEGRGRAAPERSSGPPDARARGASATADRPRPGGEGRALPAAERRRGPLALFGPLGGPLVAAVARAVAVPRTQRLTRVLAASPALAVLAPEPVWSGGEALTEPRRSARAAGRPEATRRPQAAPVRRWDAAVRVADTGETRSVRPAAEVSTDRAGPRRVHRTPSARAAARSMGVGGPRGPERASVGMRRASARAGGGTSRAQSAAPLAGAATEWLVRALRPVEPPPEARTLQVPVAPSSDRPPVAAPTARVLERLATARTPGGRASLPPPHAADGSRRSPERPARGVAPRGSEAGVPFARREGRAGARAPSGERSAATALRASAASTDRGELRGAADEGPIAHAAPRAAGRAPRAAGADPLSLAAARVARADAAVRWAAPAGTSSRRTAPWSAEFLVAAPRDPDAAGTAPRATRRDGARIASERRPGRAAPRASLPTAREVSRDADPGAREPSRGSVAAREPSRASDVTAPDASRASDPAARATSRASVAARATSRAPDVTAREASRAGDPGSRDVVRATEHAARRAERAGDRPGRSAAGAPDGSSSLPRASAGGVRAEIPSPTLLRPADPAPPPGASDPASRAGGRSPARTGPRADPPSRGPWRDAGDAGLRSGRRGSAREEAVEDADRPRAFSRAAERVSARGGEAGPPAIDPVGSGPVRAPRRRSAGPELELLRDPRLLRTSESETIDLVTPRARGTRVARPGGDLPIRHALGRVPYRVPALARSAPRGSSPASRVERRAWHAPLGTERVGLRSGAIARADGRSPALLRVAEGLRWLGPWLEDRGLVQEPPPVAQAGAPSGPGARAVPVPPEREILRALRHATLRADRLAGAGAEPAPRTARVRPGRGAVRGYLPDHAGLEASSPRPLRSARGGAAPLPSSARVPRAAAEGLARAPRASLLDPQIGAPVEGGSTPAPYTPGFVGDRSRGAAPRGWHASALRGLDDRADAEGGRHRRGERSPVLGTFQASGGSVGSHELPAESARSGTRRGDAPPRAGDRPAREARLGARSEALIRALARARRPEEVVRVVVEHRGDAVALSREIDAPAGRLVRRIAQYGGSARSAPRRTPARTSRSELLRPTRAFRTPSKSAGPSEGRQGVGDSRITKLAHKLMGLIHLAESERRVEEAQRHVRMAEDSAAARPEMGHGAAATGMADPAAERKHYETLAQDVLDNVLRELERNQQRREDPDGGGIWW